MNLNMDIIFERLSEITEVTRFGADSRDLCLRHIAFYDPEKPLRDNCLYLAYANDLVEQSVRCRNRHFVCVGGRAPQNLTRGGNSLLVIENQNDLLKVFNIIQDTFLYYEAWDDRLHGIIKTTADISEMIIQSVPVLNNPLSLVNRDLHILVKTNVIIDNAGRRELQVSLLDEPMPLEHAVDIKEILLTHKQRTEPFFCPESNCNINLFLNNAYAGVVTMRNDIHGFTQGDLVLFRYLSNLLVEAMHKQTKVRFNHIVTLKSTLNDLLNHCSVKMMRLRQALGSDKPEPFFCFEIKPNGDSYGLPIGYLCDELEQLIPGCIALEHESLVVCYVRLNSTSCSYDEILRILWKFLHDMGFQAGVSNVFTDVIGAYYYFRQAYCAIETGQNIHPNKHYYLFSDYVLPYMLLNCTGELRPRFVCPEGLLQLHSQSRKGSVDYWETLKVYLNNEMNATQTAKELYLHRSTMLQRLAKINAVLGLDLHNPLQRMYIHACIYILDMKASSEKLFKDFEAELPRPQAQM
jgi:hypothetical protein